MRIPGVPAHAAASGHVNAPPSVSAGSQLAPTWSVPAMWRLNVSGVVTSLYASTATMYVPAATSASVTSEDPVDTPPSSSHARPGSLQVDGRTDSTVSTTESSVSSVRACRLGTVSMNSRSTPPSLPHAGA